MNDPLIAQFAAACGAAGPLDLKVDLVEGGVLAEGTVPMPFTLIGRDDACDVTLTDADVNPRHAWLQAVGGRLFAVDLGSRTGLGWPDGSAGSGWLDVDNPVQIGPFRVWLRTPVSARPARFAPGYSPLQSDAAGVKSRPAVALEFRNGRRAKDRWTVNRLVTLVGRSPDCKIHLTADDIAGFHCGLVLTPDGLWVVDLSGRGVVVNGERMRVSPLRHGAELWVGRFLIGVHYPPNAPATRRPGVLAEPLSGAPLAVGDPDEARDAVTRTPLPPAPAEDEVPLGETPVGEPENGLPSSHIMADVFRVWTEGPVSNPIAVGAAGPTPADVPLPVARSAPTPIDLFAPTVPLVADLPEAAVQLLRQLGDVNAQIFAQSQQSLVLTVQLFGCLRRDQLLSVQRELARIQELNTELTQLHAELARRAVEALPRPAPRVTTSHPTPMPEPTPARTPSPDSTALHEWVMDRLDTLQRERQLRWNALVGLFSDKTT